MNSFNRRLSPAPTSVKPAGSRMSAPAPQYGDELRTLALEIAQHDPVLAHLLVRAGERVKVKSR